MTEPSIAYLMDHPKPKTEMSQKEEPPIGPAQIIWVILTRAMRFQTMQEHKWLQHR